MPGPSNLYGLSNPVALPLQNFLNGPFACPSGTETTILSMPLMVAPSSGYFYPLIWFSLLAALGAVLPTSYSIAGKIGAGSDFDNMYFVPSGAMASQYTFCAAPLLGPVSNTLWQPPGSVINITANPVGQAMSIYNIKVIAALFRAPDQ